VVFILTGLNQRPDLADPWILWFGAIRPHQWLTAFFMHAGFAHLIGNMVFLWAFGLVVEGKLGWKKFIPLYLMLGISQCAVEQFIMWGADAEGQRREQMEYLGLLDEDGADEDGADEDEADADVDENFELDVDDDLIEQSMQDIPFPGVPGMDDDEEEPEPTEEEIRQQELQLRFETNRQQGVLRILKTRPVMFGALGASGAIYSLLAMSLVWAPKNDMQVVGLFGFRFVSFEVSIMLFSAFYIGLDLLIAAFTGFGMSTAFLHTMGAITGTIFGVAMFKLGKVDCEDWDIFSVLSGNYGPHVRDVYGYRTEQGKKTKYSHPTVEEEDRPKKRTRLQKVNDLIDDGDYLTAYEEFFSVRINKPDATLPAEQFKELGMGLVADEYFDEAEAVLEDYIDEHPDSANWACLRLAAIQLQNNGQPRASYKTVRRVNKSTLSDKERDMARKIAKAAKKQIDAGIKDREPEW
ncbi:MAG: rhomboid family intramembrane serine protease, partial [Planctomycetaceae bacterium]